MRQFSPFLLVSLLLGFFQLLFSLTHSLTDSHLFTSSSPLPFFPFYFPPQTHQYPIFPAPNRQRHTQLINTFFFFFLVLPLSSLPPCYPSPRCRRGSPKSSHDLQASHLLPATPVVSTSTVLPSSHLRLDTNNNNNNHVCSGNNPTSPTKKKKRTRAALRGVVVLFAYSLFCPLVVKAKHTPEAKKSDRLGDYSSVVVLFPLQPSLTHTFTSFTLSQAINHLTHID